MAELEKKFIAGVDASGAANSIKEMRQELKQCRDAMLSLEKGTDEYNKVLKKAADIQHDLKEQMEEINANAADFGQIVGNVTKTLGGMTATVQTVQAGLNLMGINAEATTQTIAKMQSMMALTQGLQGIDAAIKAFKRLSATMKSMTVAGGALAVLLWMWERYKTTKQEAIEAEKRHAEQLRTVREGELAETIKALERQLTLQEKINQVFGVKESDTIKQEIEVYKNLIKEQEAAIKGSQTSLEDWLAAGKSFDDYLKVMNVDTALATETIEAYKKKIDELNISLKEAQALEAARALAEENKRGKELGKNLDEIQSPLGFATEVLDAGAIVQDGIAQMAESVEQRWYTAMVKMRNDSKMSADQMVNIFAVSAQAMGQLFNTIADMQDESSEEGFKAQKGLRIAGAVMDTIGGSLSAFTGAVRDLGFPAGPIVGAIMATAITAMGAAQIAQINKMQYKKNGSQRAAVPSAVALGSMGNNVSAVNQIQGASEQGNVADSRVYVLESDIASTSKKVNVAESEATF